MKRAPEGNSAGLGWMRPDPIRMWIRGHRLLCLFGCDAGMLRFFRHDRVGFRFL